MLLVRNPYEQAEMIHTTHPEPDSQAIDEIATICVNPVVFFRVFRGYRGVLI